jgi:pimeloyl-ACP methyl ester carboxylesterase
MATFPARDGTQICCKDCIDCIKAFSETDFTDDLKEFDVPTLILHGDDDRADRSFGSSFIQNCQRRRTQSQFGRAAWPVFHSQGPDQRGIT